MGTAPPLRCHDYQILKDGHFLRESIFFGSE